MSLSSLTQARAKTISLFSWRQEDVIDLVEQVINGCGDPHIRRCLDALYGVDSSMDVLLGSNGVERTRLAAALATEAASRTRRDCADRVMLDVNHPDWEFDANTAVVDLTSIRKLRVELDETFESSISVVQFRCRQTAEGGFRYAAQVKAVIFGDNNGRPGGAAQLMEKSAASRFGAFRISMSLRKHAHCFTDVANMFDMFDPFRSIALQTLGKVDCIRETAEALPEPITVLYRSLALSQMSALVAGTGDFEPIVVGALAESAHRARRRFEASDQPLPSSQVSAFCSEKLRPPDAPFSQLLLRM